VHQFAVDSLFETTTPARHISNKLYPQFPAVERLRPHRTMHIGLGPLLENEGTIQGTYQVIDKISLDQFRFEQVVDFEKRLQLVYGELEIRNSSLRIVALLALARSDDK
jgi:hypothetical protein